MKEIDINIEGYNVNGICVGCLNYNRKMFYRDEVYECFKNLAEIDVPDGLSIQVCWECLAAVQNTNRFRDQILRAYDVLLDYSKKHTFLNSPQDLSQYSTQRLTVTSQEPTNFTVRVKDDDKVDVELDLKTELDEKVELDYDTAEDFEDLKPDFEELSQDTEYPIADPSSEDDIQLSELKAKRKGKKKDRKGKRKKRKDELLLEKAKETNSKSTRKLKNLPEHIVELHTMDEEEMWQVRNEDRTNKEFLKLKYKCDECIIGFNTEKLMKDHWIGKHRRKGDESQQCDVCKAYFLTKDNLSIHRSLHTTAFRCMECAFCTTVKRIMMKHVKVHMGSNEGFQCGTCGKNFGTKSKLTYHKNVCHQEKPQCDCCGKVFANKMTLKYHLKLLPQNKDDTPKEKLYLPCKGCNKVFHSKKSYRAHVVIHDGVTYPCPICGKLFQWKRNLARHTRAHREKEAGARHECRECGKTFASRDCLNNHKRLSKRHVPDSALGHECNYCGKKFATKYCMVDHIDWDHLKRIKYQCSVCFKAFKTSKIMVAHMNNIHEGKRNREPEGDHLCEICGKSYKTVKRLKGHVWAMHTKRSSTKSYRCKYCPATFTWQTSIYKHVKGMHKGPRNKQPQRALPAVKKQEPYTIQYYSHLDLGHDNMAHHIDIVQSLA